MLKRYEARDDLLERLDGVVAAASRTEFYRDRFGARKGVRSLEEFRELPVTPIAEYRRSSLADAVNLPGEIEWIMGQYAGQRGDRVAVSEGPEESATRCDLFVDAVKERFGPSAGSGQAPGVGSGQGPGAGPFDKLRGASGQGPGAVAAVLAPGFRRFFGAELCTALIRAGVTTHLFIDSGPRAYELLRHVGPDLLAAPCDEVDEARLPETVRLCVTFGQRRALASRRQLDLLYVDGLGFLGQSDDCRSYALNSDEYLFETSPRGLLVATQLFNRVQPMIRIETCLAVETLDESASVLVRAEVRHGLPRGAPTTSARLGSGTGKSSCSSA